MTKPTLYLVFLICLGLAILQLVSAEKENEELEATSKDVVQAHADGKMRSIREAEAKRRSKKKRRRNGKKARKANKKKRKNKKSKRKQRRNKKNNSKRSKDKNNQKRTNTIVKQSTCDVAGLCQKIKNYIKYSNQLRKLKRLNKTCETMDKKKAKGEGGEFSASADANSGIDDANVTSIAEELKNCSTTVKEKCESKTVNGCLNAAGNVKCIGELEAWIAKFGPAKGSCLQANTDCCACINAISPDPSADCLDFDAVEKDAKTKKKTCTGSGTKGSFGYCRQLQQSAAEKGPAAAKTKCKAGGASASTSGSAGRRMLFRNNLLKKWIKA